MTTTWSRGLTISFALCIAFAFGPACQPDQEGGTTAGEQQGDDMDVTPSEQDIKPTYQIVIEADETGPEGWATIPVVRLRAGESARLQFPGTTVWMLIPDASLEVIGTGVQRAEADDFIALKFGGEGVVLRLPAEFTGSPRDFHYSVLAVEDSENGTWRYIHGNNPPPRMIIGG